MSAVHLPSGWRSGVTDDGKMYYINDFTKTTQWNPPLAQQETKEGKEGSEEPRVKLLGTAPIGNYPCPVVAADESGQPVLVFVTRQSILTYKPSSNTLLETMKLSSYKLKHHTAAYNPSSKQLYLYCGSNNVFHVVCYGDTHSKSTADLEIHATNKKLLEQHQVPSNLGSGTSSLYCSKSNEFHVIGGKSNEKGSHFTFDHETQTFREFSTFGSKLIDVEFHYVECKDCLVVFGGNLQHDMYVLSLSAASHPWRKLASAFPPDGARYALAQFGCCVYQDRYMVTFGGGMQTLYSDRSVADVYVCDAQDNWKWKVSKYSLPRRGRFFAVALEAMEASGGSDRFHVFQQFEANGGHWRIDADLIMDKGQLFTQQETMALTANISNRDIYKQLTVVLQTVNAMNKEIAALRRDVNEIKQRVGIKHVDEELELDHHVPPAYSEGSKATFQ